MVVGCWLVDGCSSNPRADWFRPVAKVDAKGVARNAPSGVADMTWCQREGSRMELMRFINSSIVD